MKILLLFCCAFAVLYYGCKDNANTANTNTNISATYCFWLSTLNDTYVSEDDWATNNGANGTLEVGKGESVRSYIYLDFPHIQLPDGAALEYAKLELFHSGTREDGTSDDIVLDVGAITREWSSGEMLWDNRPDIGFSPFSGNKLYGRSGAWCGTENIAAVVASMIAKPDKYFGFQISAPNTIDGTHKKFLSMNGDNRTNKDLGKAPRLLLKIKLPTGMTSKDVKFPANILGSELAKFDAPITVTLSRQANDFPAEWEVSPDR